MNLDNVRNLKLEFLSQVVSSFTAAMGDLPESVVFNRATQSGNGRTGGALMIGVGIAPASAGEGFHLAVRVTDRRLAASPPLIELRNKAKGELDVRCVGQIQALSLLSTLWNRHQVRPLESGISISHFRTTAGTLGAFVQPHSGATMCVLSNNHVLADVNRGRKGDAILQPGSRDDGENPDDVIGYLETYEPISFIEPNIVDAATAVLAKGISVRQTGIRGACRLRGVAAEDILLRENLRLQKRGRTTGLTSGRLSAIEIDGLKITFGEGRIATFNSQIEIESTTTKPFSLGGDSGSLVFTSDGYAVGLLFAASETGGLTYANPLRAVLDTLDIELAL